MPFWMVLKSLLQLRNKDESHLIQCDHEIIPAVTVMEEGEMDIIVVKIGVIIDAAEVEVIPEDMVAIVPEVDHYIVIVAIDIMMVIEEKVMIIMGVIVIDTIVENVNMIDRITITLRNMSFVLLMIADILTIVKMRKNPAEKEAFLLV